MSTYNIRVVALREGKELEDAHSLQFDSVASVSSNAKDGVKLNLASTGSKSMADVKQTF